MEWKLTGIFSGCYDDDFESSAAEMTEDECDRESSEGEREGGNGDSVESGGEGGNGDSVESGGEGGNGDSVESGGEGGNGDSVESGGEVDEVIDETSEVGSDLDKTVTSGTQVSLYNLLSLYLFHSVRSSQL